MTKLGSLLSAETVQDMRRTVAESYERKAGHVNGRVIRPIHPAKIYARKYGRSPYVS